MSATDQPSEEELRAAYEAELKQIRVEQILLEQVVTLINLGMRRTGLQPGTEDERDPAQVRIAIEAVRALMPLVEDAAGPQAGAIQEALSQMQLAYVRLGGGTTSEQAGGPAPGNDPAGSDPAGPPPPPPGPAADPGAPGPAQRSGRLWTPGQP
jgi:hypothetical protein